MDPMQPGIKINDQKGRECEVNCHIYVREISLKAYINGEGDDPNVAFISVWTLPGVTVKKDEEFISHYGNVYWRGRRDFVEKEKKVNVPAGDAAGDIGKEPVSEDNQVGGGDGQGDDGWRDEAEDSHLDDAKEDDSDYVPRTAGRKKRARRRRSRSASSETESDSLASDSSSDGQGDSGESKTKSRKKKKKHKKKGKDRRKKKKQKKASVTPPPDYNRKRGRGSKDDDDVTSSTRSKKRAKAPSQKTPVGKGTFILQ